MKLRYVALVALAFYGSVIGAVYAFGPEDPSRCDLYPSACAVEDQGSTLNQALRKQAECQHLTGDAYFRCSDEYWTLYQQYQDEAAR